MGLLLAGHAVGTEQGSAGAISRPFKDLSDSGEVIAAASGIAHRVLGYYITADTEIWVQFHTGGAAGAAISPKIYLQARSGGSPAPNPYGWFQTVAGENLYLVSSAAAGIGVQLIVAAVA